MTIHYKGNIPPGALQPPPRRRRSDGNEFDEEVNSYDNADEAGGGRYRRNSPRSSRHERHREADQYQNQGRFNSNRKPDSNSSRRMDTDNDNTRKNYVSDSRKSDAGNSRHRNNIADNYSDYQDEHDYSPDARKGQQKKEKSIRKKHPGGDDDESDSYNDADGTSRRNKSSHRSGWVTKSEYDELSILCEKLLEQQHELKNELKQQASVIQAQITLFQLTFTINIIFS